MTKLIIITEKSIIFNFAKPKPKEQIFLSILQLKKRVHRCVFSFVSKCLFVHFVISQGRKIFFSQCSEGQHDTIITREAAYMHCYKDLDISSDQRKMTPKYSRSEKNTITSGFWTIKALILKWTTMCLNAMQGLKIGGKSGDLFRFVDLRYISGICRMADACKSVEN